MEPIKLILNYVWQRGIAALMLRKASDEAKRNDEDNRPDVALKKGWAKQIKHSGPSCSEWASQGKRVHKSW